MNDNSFQSHTGCRSLDVTRNVLTTYTAPGEKIYRKPSECPVHHAFVRGSSGKKQKKERQPSHPTLKNIVHSKGVNHPVLLSHKMNRRGHSAEGAGEIKLPQTEESASAKDAGGEEGKMERGNER